MRRRYHHPDLRAALLRAAERLVGERGPAGFTLREAARSVGVSQTAPYRHFADKEALLAALAEGGFARLAAALAQAAAVARAPRARLEAIGCAYVQFALAEPATFAVMYSAETARSASPSLRVAKDAAFAELTAAVAAAQRDGLVRRGRLTELALPLWAAVHGVALLLAERSSLASRLPALSPAQLARRVVRTVVAGLA